MKKLKKFNKLLMALKNKEKMFRTKQRIKKKT